MRRRRYHGRRGMGITPDKIGAAVLTLLIMGTLALGAKVSVFLKELASQMALSDATDMVTLAINDTISRKMNEEKFDYNYFVTLERDADGGVAAITTNMTRINSFSSDILRDVVTASDSGKLDIRIPVGNLLGLNILLGKGPEIPVDIIMLTSSFADFRNEMVSAGINQIKHQIILEVVVDIDILVPWETMSTKVVTETLIAETVVVGKVPNTYIDAG